MEAGAKYLNCLMLSRRQALAASLASWVVANSAHAAVIDPVERLRAFLLSAVGRPTIERVATANRALSNLTPLADASVLVEVAAIGILVRAQPTSESIRDGYPRRSRAALDLAQRRYGGLAWTQALDGAWHYEVVRRSRIGAMVYGASRSRGDELFAAARRLDLADFGLVLSEAVALIGTESDEARQRAKLQLASAPVAPDTPYDRFVSESVSQLLSLLNSQRNAEATRFAATLF